MSVMGEISEYTFVMEWKLEHMIGSGVENSSEKIYNEVCVFLEENHPLDHVASYMSDSESDFKIHFSLSYNIKLLGERKGYVHVKMGREFLIIKLVKNEDEYLSGIVTGGKITEKDYARSILCTVILRKNEYKPYEEAYLLKQHNTDGNFTLDFQSLLDNKVFCDVRILLADGKELQAHKAILAARSTVFASMFEHDMREKAENLVKVEDISHEVFKKLLKFIYSGNFEGLEESANDLFAVADKYNLVDLKLKCEREHSENLTLENAIGIMILADKHNSNHLKIATQYFIMENSKELVNTTEFKELKTSHPHLLEEMYCMVVEHYNPKLFINNF